MATIIRERERKTHTRHVLNFYETNTDEICWGFPMINGKVIPCKDGKEPSTYVPCSEAECSWWQNYLKAKEDEEKEILYSVAEDESWQYSEPAIAKCECGKEITLNYDAEECPYCGRLHNLFGQELLPRKFWEEY